MQRRSFLGALGGLPAVAMASSITNVASPRVASGKRVGRRVGIAFGGGSMHGIAHVGVLKAFAEKKVKVEFIAGTSVGAIVGVLAAAQLPLSQIDTVTRSIEWPGLMSLSWSGKGLLQNAKLRKVIDKALGDRKIEQLPIAFGAIATDLATGARVLIRKGAAGIAVDASCSIPVFFTPVKIDGRELVDGGLTEPVPVIALREMGADIVIGVDVAYRPNEDQFKGFSGVAFQTMHIMANALIKEQIGRADVAITMNLHRFVGHDNARDQLIEAGYKATMLAWPRIAGLIA